MLKSNEVFLQLEKVTGDINKTNTYSGQFTVKKYLTNRERNEASKMAERLGAGLDKTTTAYRFCLVVAHLSKHVVDAPNWWKDSDGGWTLEDEEPVYALADMIYDAQNPTPTPAPTAPVAPTT